MEEKEIREKVKQEVEEIWEKELKKSFDKQIQNSLKEILLDLKDELKRFDATINSQIQEIDKNFEEKWNKRFQEEMSQIEQLQKQNINNNNNDDEDGFNIIDNNDDEKYESGSIKNKENIGLNNINNYLDNKKEDDESDEELRKKQVNLDELNNPRLVNLNMDGNSNVLINIALFCLVNIKGIVEYYLNPIKEEKILKKSKEYPMNTFLGPSFLKLLDHFWKSSKNEYSTSEIHNTLKKIMLGSYDSNDFGVIFDLIINSLNDELINNQIIDEEPKEILDYFKEKESFKIYLKNFQKKKSIVSDLFFSTVKIRKKCETYLLDRIFFESSPVINIYLESNNEIEFNNISLTENLKTLLNKDTKNIKEECNVCHGQHEIFVGRDIFATSSIIIININREKDPNNEIIFDYPEEFDGKKVINGDDSLKLPKYELISVIKKVNNIEYMNCYKSFINNQWYAYTNQKIFPLQNNMNHIFDKKNACILIYQRI